MTEILTHQHDLKPLIGSWIMQVDLSWAYLVSGIVAELVWDLPWGLIQVNFHGGMLYKSVKCKR